MMSKIKSVREKVVQLTQVNPDQIREWSEKQALYFIRDKVLASLEMHELDEWFKVDGQHVIAPHGGQVYQARELSS